MHQSSVVEKTGYIEALLRLSFLMKRHGSNVISLMIDTKSISKAFHRGSRPIHLIQ